MSQEIALILVKRSGIWYFMGDTVTLVLSMH